MRVVKMVFLLILWIVFNKGQIYGRDELPQDIKAMYTLATNYLKEDKIDELEILLEKLLNYTIINGIWYRNEESFNYYALTLELLYEVKLKKEDYIYAFAIYNELSLMGVHVKNPFKGKEVLLNIEEYFNVKEKIKEIYGKVNLEKWKASKLFDKKEKTFLELKSNDKYEEIPIIAVVFDKKNQQLVDKIIITCKDSEDAIFKIVCDNRILSSKVMNGRVGFRIEGKISFFTLSLIYHEKPVKISEVSISFYKVK